MPKEKPTKPADAAPPPLQQPAKAGLPVDREAELRAQVEAQQRLLAKVATSSKFISFKGGNIIIDKKAIPGAQTEAIALAFMAERTYFPGDFDPDTRQSPACYAYAELGQDEEEMVPHPAVKDKQHDNCADCQWNKWNTAAKGRGKACRESIRLALLPNIKNLARAETWHARIPITSVPFFKEFAGGVLGYGKALWSVIAKLKVVPDEKHFFHVLWEAKGEVPEEHRAAVEAKARTAEANINFPYPDFTEEEAPMRKGQQPTGRVNTKLSKQKPPAAAK